MTEFKINRGLSSNLPSKLTDGWVYFCTDTGEIYTDCIDNGILRRKKIKSLDALQKSGGTMEGALKFTSQTHFGTATPTIAEEGQVFFLNTDSGIEDKNALKKAGDTMEGVLRFTDGVHFGDTEPEVGDEGQIYFVEDEGGGETVKPFAVIGVEYPAGSVCTCTSSDGATVLTADDDGGKCLFIIPCADTWIVSCTNGNEEANKEIIVSEEYQYIYVFLNFLSNFNGCSWSQISEISASGQAANYWSVGDCKAVDIKGTVGTVALDTTLYVYIIGFDHNGATNTIDFGTFKTAPEGGVNVCLDDSKYNTYSSGDSTKYFNLNHDTSNSFNIGGWKGCDLRYDILGSTDVAPSGYGGALTASRTGYDATSTCATNPVPDTLMAALPADLRAVMKPMEIWSDNVGRLNLNDGQIDPTYITTSIDYLPLLAEYEIFGARFHANNYEQEHQAQYTYYSAGNSKVKYRYSKLNSAARWWVRSPRHSDTGFCNIHTNGASDYITNSWSYFSYGLSPIFRV